MGVGRGGVGGEGKGEDRKGKLVKFNCLKCKTSRQKRQGLTSSSLHKSRIDWEDGDL